MRSTLLFLMLLMSTVIYSQDLTTNLRVAQDKNGKNPSLISYNIKTVDGVMTFDCLNAELDFDINLTDTLSQVIQGDYVIVTLDTDNSDQVAIIYLKGVVTTICLQQINGVDLFYIKSKIKVKEPEAPTYRL